MKTLGSAPVKRGGVERLAKNGVHWQTLGTSTSTRATNEPTRDILPEYGLSCKRSNRKREYSRSQPEGEALYLRCVSANFCNEQGHNILPTAQRSANCDVGDHPAGLWLSGAGDRTLPSPVIGRRWSVQLRHCLSTGFSQQTAPLTRRNRSLQIGFLAEHRYCSSRQTTSGRRADR